MGSAHFHSSSSSGLEFSRLSELIPMQRSSEKRTMEEETKGNRKQEYCAGNLAMDDIVISGVSGRFPEADNVGELAERLLSQKILYGEAEERWNKGSNFRNTIGMIKDISKFDANFFNITSNSANTMDPKQRMLLETTYETIVDAGYHPKCLKGKRIGVYIGENTNDATFITVEQRLDTKATNIGSFICANRISYFFDFVGPSMMIDTACSSSMTAMDMAVFHMKHGHIESAIVGGAHLCLHPVWNWIYANTGILSASNECHPFEERADGMIRSDTVACMYLQKAKDARRVYAKVLDITSQASGFVREGITSPCPLVQTKVMQESLKRSGKSSLEINYVETHGTGTTVGDVAEIKSLDAGYCIGRKTPLLIGSIKSNLAHTEASSGLLGVIKAIITFETGIIPPHINYKKPHPECSALVEGRMKIVTEPTPFEGELISVNNFGFGGVLCHTVLQRNQLKNCLSDGRHHTFPQIALYGATTQEALNDLFEFIAKSNPSEEFYALLHKSAYISPHSNMYRGYAIIDQAEKQPKNIIERVDAKERKIWYIFDGMGCQWNGMGMDLMQCDVFAQSIKRSASILKPFGFDLLDVLNPQKDHLNRDRKITPAFVAISAIQIALVDVLKALEIEPDGIIGHSTGELVCSYADGCSTAEQTILSAYYRGIAVESSNLPKGEMAAVGLSWDEVKRRCPEGVFPACHNAEDSVTVSGSKESVEKFVTQLRAENIFARKVNAYGYAFHCNYIVAAADVLMNYLTKIYTNPQPRSPKWISTTFREEDWNRPECRFANAAYFTNNLTSEVRFYDALAKIPSDAIVIEIAPHFLLQAILKRAVGFNASYIGLMKRNERNSRFMLSSIGQMYNLGLDPQVENLYPMVKFPVPRGTPMISNLIKWNHSQSWFVPKFDDKKSGSLSYTINLQSTDRHLLDHCISGRSLYPATGYVYLAWNAICDANGKAIRDTSIAIDNLKIFRATILDSRDKVTFHVQLLEVGGAFEIKESNSLVASGFIRVVSKSPVTKASEFQFKDDVSVLLSRPAIYDELKIVGYEYGPAFRGVVETNIDGTQGYVSWNDEWISFLDSLLFFFCHNQKDHDFKLPTGILSVKINPQQHYEYLSQMGNNQDKGVPVLYDPHTKCCLTPGVAMKSLKVEPVPQRFVADVTPVYEEYLFVPYMDINTEASSNQNTISQLGDAFFTEMAEYLQCSYDVPITGEQVQRIWGMDNCSDVLNHYIKLIDDEELSHVFAALATSKDGSDVFSKLTKDENFLNGFSKDIMHLITLKEVPIRHLLDLVVENSTGKLNVVELCETGNMVALNVSKMLLNILQNRLNYVVLHHDPKAVSQVDIDSVQIISLGDKKEGISAMKGSANLGIGSFVFGNDDSLRKHIQSLASLVTDDGFLLLVHRHTLTPQEQALINIFAVPGSIQPESKLEATAKAENLVVVSKKSVIFGSRLYLFRKILVKPHHAQSHTIIHILEDSYSKWLKELKQAVKFVQKNAASSLPIWLVAEDSPVNGIIGMVNCLKQELGGEKIRCVFTDKKMVSSSAPPFRVDDVFYSEVVKRDLVMNVYQNGCWGSFRHKTMPEKEIIEPKEYAYINCRRLGDLSSFAWFESSIPYRTPLGSENTLYHIYYSSLNFKDVMLATAKLSKSTVVQGELEKNNCFLGLEFSGRDSLGRRVMGMVSNSSMATAVLADPEFVFDVPDHWSLEEAATIPVVYSTCYYAFFIRGKLSKGDKVLIHSGTGGIGQAAIRIAMSLNCEVFTTVGSEEKKRVLLKTFPRLKAKNIASSRDLTFEDMIMRRTNGKGVNVVLNSLAEDKFQASIRCLGKNGCFLEIGKFDMSVDNTLGLSTFLKNVTFHGVFMDYLMAGKEMGHLKSELVNYITEGIKAGVVQPLNTTVFDANDVEKAFRYMASGQHIGKIILKIREDEGKKLVIPKLMKVDAIKQLYFYSKKSYIVIGGLGGFGIELVKWMVSKGARNIVVTSRYGARSSYHNLCLKRWNEQGVTVLVSLLNVVRNEEAKKLLQKASTFGPVGGIFNSAAVLRDAFLENQNVQYFRESCEPKALATKHLDEHSRTLCPDLDMFVCFSSISCGRGNAGQTNYGFSNSVMERVCEERRKDGLHGLAIQWGIVGDVGLVHRNMGDDAMIAGIISQRIRSCLDTLETFLIQSHPVVTSFVRAETRKSKKVSQNIFEKLAKIFNVRDVNEINKSLSFGEMGIDSVIGVELKQVLENAFEEELNMKQIQEMKINDIKIRILNSDKKEKSSRKNSSIKSIYLHPPKNWTSSEALIALNSDRKGIPIFILHGNEPFLENLAKFSKHLEIPVYGLRCTKSTPMSSLKEMARWHLKQIQNSCSFGPVHLIGCSSGAILALEMTLQSEMKPGLLPSIKSLVFLDSSLEMMDLLSDLDQSTKMNSETFEASEIANFLSRFSDTDLFEVLEDLKLTSTLKGKINKVLDILQTSESTPLSHEKMIESLRHHVAKQNLMRTYVPAMKLKKDLNIIEDSVSVLPNDVALVKSFMSKVCDGNISISRMIGNGKLLTDEVSSVAKFLNEMYGK